MSRFSRQVILPGFGPEAQSKLKKAKVLVIGAGGLGCPNILYLAAAGIGNIAIMDGDTVSESNLNRQVIFGEAEIGINKAEAAAHYLKSKYSDIQIHTIPEFISPSNAVSWISQYDIIVDGSDNFATRYLVNDTCVLLGKPLVFAAIYQNEGQVAIFNAYKYAINYRDLYPEPPKENDIPNCSETGVLGVLPGIIGTIQAAETIKFLTGYGNNLVDKMLYYNLLTQQTYQIELSKNENTMSLIPESPEELASRNYAFFCDAEEGVSWNDALRELKNNPQHILIDVREPHETPKLLGYKYFSMPVSNSYEISSEIEKAESIFLFCQSGIRSLRMARDLKKKFIGKNIYSILGGIESPESPLN
ncbi:HesA/MoeB/ThiF family protein [Cecembia rubra]|uniref:Molybdopterin-synthase adenylyltransferase n=1 Tax=Cecembia rubra TaxID=1485585 RepID=A0A2P8ECY6_9BACT|nr:HesA/MoeB/ThiF family protein [Cecembia rubra]PSL07333.1 adenylyltransferase/sulfurtransferase [Cecembia rubra]